LREIETRISYCDDECYAEHCVGAVLVIENNAKASEVALRANALPLQHPHRRAL
jgi:hypothetical protein